MLNSILYLNTEEPALKYNIFKVLKGLENIKFIIFDSLPVYLYFISTHVLWGINCLFEQNIILLYNIVYFLSLYFKRFDR